jgi:hypothetical protein
MEKGIRNMKKVEGETYPVKERDEDVDGEGVPSWSALLDLLTRFVLAWGKEVLEILQSQCPEITHTGESSRQTGLHVIILRRPAIEVVREEFTHMKSVTTLK